MRVQAGQADLELLEQHESETAMDIVVPFTTPPLTQLALDAANRLAVGLNATIRLVKVQAVPYPMDPDQSPVALDFICEQLRHFRSELPVKPQVRLARELVAGLTSVLKRSSVVIIGCRNRLWRTHEERLTASLRRARFHAILVPQGSPGDVPYLPVSLGAPACPSPVSKTKE